MMKDNLGFKIKQSDMLHPILEFVIGGGTTFISAVFCMGQHKAMPFSQMFDFLFGH